MKVSKIFGFVLFLHLGVIGVLVVQPGCRTTQPPTETYRHEGGMDRPAPGIRRDAGKGLIPATRVDGLDPAFNAGMADEDRFAPRRPETDYGDFGAVEGLEPIRAEGPTVEVTGTGYQTHTVKKGDSLWALSKRYGVSLDELYAANDLNKNSVLRIGQVIRIPSEGESAAVTTVTPDAYQPSGFTGETRTHTVRRGDTLSGIARRYDTTVRAIQAANGKDSDLIRVGEELTIPVGPGGATSAGGTPTSTSAPGGSAASPSAPPPSDASGYRTHVVKAGEYPAGIARRYGMTSNELLALNGITDPRSLQVGQRLKVSGEGEAANVDSRTDTVSAPAPSGPAARSEQGPVEIRVVEADPLVEGESDAIDEEAMFENATEIPVIRLEEDELE